MAYLLYDIILSLSSLLLVPYYLFRGLKHGKSRRGIRERLGFYEPNRFAPLAGRDVIWIHAVSVGETRAAIPLMKALREKYPDTALVLSNVTETGHAIALELKTVDLCLFFPFDLSWAVGRALDQVKPDMIIIVETEIWPNFVRLAKLRKIPVLLVNGRISDRSYPRYRLFRFLVKSVLSNFTWFCMQTAQDAARVRALGGPADRIMTTGNLKFDMKASDETARNIDELRATYGLPSSVHVWAAGSTHAGEEEILLDVFQRLIKDDPELILALAPRHPERARSVSEQLTKRGITHVRRSELEDSGMRLEPGSVLLVDTLGEILNIYALSDVVFVGGSLVPVGGHNVLEASLVKKPAIFGRHMNNFKTISNLLMEAGGGLQVQDAEELYLQLRRLLGNPLVRSKIGESGYALLAENSGATEQTLTLIDFIKS